MDGDGVRGVVDDIGATEIHGIDVDRIKRIAARDRHERGVLRRHGSAVAPDPHRAGVLAKIEGEDVVESRTRFSREVSGRVRQRVFVWAEAEDPLVLVTAIEE
jgi:hypothetical protein